LSAITFLFFITFFLSDQMSGLEALRGARVVYDGTIIAEVAVADLLRRTYAASMHPLARSAGYQFPPGETDHILAAPGVVVFFGTYNRDYILQAQKTGPAVVGVSYNAAEAKELGLEYAASAFEFIRKLDSESETFKSLTSRYVEVINKSFAKTCDDLERAMVQAIKSRPGRLFQDKLDWLYETQPSIASLIETGRAELDLVDKTLDDWMRKSRVITFHGRPTRCCYVPTWIGEFTDLWMRSKASPETEALLLLFRIQGTTISFTLANVSPQEDASAIARGFGGGGSIHMAGWSMNLLARRWHEVSTILAFGDERQDIAEEATQVQAHVQASVAVEWLRGSRVIAFAGTPARLCMAPCWQEAVIAKWMQQEEEEKRLLLFNVQGANVAFTLVSRITDQDTDTELIHALTNEKLTRQISWSVDAKRNWDVVGALLQVPP